MWVGRSIRKTVSPPKDSVFAQKLSGIIYSGKRFVGGLGPAGGGSFRSDTRPFAVRAEEAKGSRANRPSGSPPAFTAAPQRRSNGRGGDSCEELPEKA